MQLITICALTPQSVRSWRLTFSIIIVSNALPLLRVAVIWKRSSRLNFLEFLYPTTWPGRVHCDHIMKKANRRLYALRQLRRCGVRVSVHDSVMVVFYTRICMCCVCCVAAIFIWLLERIQKRALAIIFPGSIYSEALNLAGISALQDRRSAACHKFIAQLNPDNPVYKLVASRLESTSASTYYSLRSRDRVRTKITATNRFGDFVTNKCATDVVIFMYVYRIQHL